jgi:hypothetical protein
MLSEGLFDLIISTPQVASIVSQGGSPPQFSVHHGSLRKGYTLPAIRMTAVTTTPIVCTDGTSSVAYQRWQFDCIAGGNDPNGYLNAQRLKDALKGLLNDYRGTLAEGTVIYSSIIKMELDNPMEEGKGGYAFRSVLDYEFGFDASGLPNFLPPVPDVELDISDDDWILGPPY